MARYRDDFFCTKYLVLDLFYRESLFSSCYFTTGHKRREMRYLNVMLTSSTFTVMITMVAIIRYRHRYAIRLTQQKLCFIPRVTPSLTTATTERSAFFVV